MWLHLIFLSLYVGDGSTVQVVGVAVMSQIMTLILLLVVFLKSPLIVNQLGMFCTWKFFI
jgi:hypothetical protein